MRSPINPCYSSGRRLCIFTLNSHETASYSQKLPGSGCLLSMYQRNTHFPSMSLGADKKFSITLSPFWPLAENWLTGSDKSEGCKWHLWMFSWPSGATVPFMLGASAFPAFVQSSQLCLAVSLRYQSRDNQQTVIIICKKKKKTKNPGGWDLQKMVTSSWSCLHSTL